MKSSKNYVSGPLYPIEVQFVGSKRLNSIYKVPKTKFLKGCYVPRHNCIYVLDTLPDSEKTFVLLHELAHALFDQLADYDDEETRCDLTARFLSAFVRNWTRYQDLVRSE